MMTHSGRRFEMVLAPSLPKAPRGLPDKATIVVIEPHPRSWRKRPLANPHSTSRHREGAVRKKRITHVNSTRLNHPWRLEKGETKPLRDARGDDGVSVGDTVGERSSVFPDDTECNRQTVFLREPAPAFMKGNPERVDGGKGCREAG